jgi:hypothetical protein
MCLQTGGSMVVTGLYDFKSLHHHSDYSGSGDTGSWAAVGDGSDGSGGGSCHETHDRPLGLPPPQFLLWALAIYMVGTQAVFWVGYIFCGKVCAGPAPLSTQHDTYGKA